MNHNLKVIVGDISFLEQLLRVNFVTLLSFLTEELFGYKVSSLLKDIFGLFVLNNFY